jgi:hypothetical protein
VGDGAVNITDQNLVANALRRTVVLSAPAKKAAMIASSRMLSMSDYLAFCKVVQKQEVINQQTGKSTSNV